MSNEWSIDSNMPSKEEKYEWRAPANDQQHVEETSAPSELNIKPKDISLKPTNAPTRSGVQSGQSDWNYQSDISTTWYVLW